MLWHWARFGRLYVFIWRVNIGYSRSRSDDGWRGLNLWYVGFSLRPR